MGAMQSTPHTTAALDIGLNHLEGHRDLWCGALVGGEKTCSDDTGLTDTAGTPTHRGV